METPAGHGNDRNIPIFIDDQKVNATGAIMSGQALRNLPNPAVPADRDLWLDVPGPADDVLIRPEQNYEIKPGSHYYTAPSTINPGGYDATPGA